MKEESFMLIAMAIEKMIDFYKGNLHDINHFLKVYAFAKTIGELEQLDQDMQERLELAAVVHDIACPLCREKYGSINGKLQEQESAALVEEFFEELPVPEEIVKRVAWMAAHHHTLAVQIEPSERGMDHQILLEADYLVNAEEGGKSKEAVCQAFTKLFQTESGKRLLCSVFKRK